MLHLILGGARSGKSRFAEQTLRQFVNRQKTVSSPIYLATAQAFDEEMQTRIEQHQLQRQAENWQLVEAPLDIESALAAIDDHRAVLLDCLTLWLSNQSLLLEQQTLSYQEKSDFLTKACKNLAATLAHHGKRLQLYAVANEVGLGVVPMGEVSRLFVDHAGWLNQHVAREADCVTLVTAGIAQTIKGRQHG